MLIKSCKNMKKVFQYQSLIYISKTLYLKKFITIIVIFQ